MPTGAKAAAPARKNESAEHFSRQEYMKRLESGQDRSELLGHGQDRKPHAEAGGAAAKGKDQVAGKMDKTKNLMAQNLEKVSERGDKIKDIAAQSEELAAASGGFAAAARKLRQQQEKKNWFGF